MKPVRHLPYPADPVSPSRQRLLFSLALLSLPLAFQFADAAIVPVPESMRLVLAISVWATLVTLELACSVVIHLAWRGWRRYRRSLVTAAWRFHSR